MGEAVRHVMRELHTHHDAESLDDDAVIVCIDWHPYGEGRRSSNGG
jgi:hypothetical protein